MPDLCRTGSQPGLLATLLCLLLGLSSLSAWGEASSEEYRIGAEDDWYPFTAYRDGKVQGMSVDIVLAAFAASHTVVKLHPYPYARCMELARSGQLVACFNTSPDARIAAEYRLPQEPLFSDDILLWARKDNAQPLTDLDQLGRRKVAATIGYEYGHTFDSHPRVQRVAVRQDLNGFLMLQRKRVDFMAAFRGTSEALFRTQPQLAGQFVPVYTLHQPQLYLSFSRQHPAAEALLQRFDQGMRQIHADGRYQAILQHWQPEPAVP
ncbi:ABC transporter substrate-binding protein [Pseudomonas sp. PDM14]|uniref:substrate-binding periplasmic protein n=1 Tax=Pseudomonas sp. PDM14 TaxID=2769288 RepID=UPI001786B900|nr:ABC transporter substrate-binding protein [Pseudomonas sp. PDM14]MBD9483076.1 ABC transporter substrate-binding protein [Pseudomonas sp. PDM14]